MRGTPRDGGRDVRRLTLLLLLLAGTVTWNVGVAGAVARPSGARVVRPAIVGGESHSCALLANGTVKCWGDNFYGQLGNGTDTPSISPVAVTGLANVVAIASGAWHSCALLADGSARCWGYNNDGELGHGSGPHSSTPVVVSGLVNATAITGGAAHTCALLATGTVKCWGAKL